MNLPFSPTFFRKMDIFQQLMEYEAQTDVKRLWRGEKAVLIWAGSEHHQHIGSAIDSSHIKDALCFAETNGYITHEEKVELEPSVSHILGCLITHEFGCSVSNPAQRLDLKINRNGILAGRILVETKNLKKPGVFKKWTWDWWLIYYVAGLIIVGQLLKLCIDLYSSVK